MGFDLGDQAVVELQWVGLIEGVEGFFNRRFKSLHLIVLSLAFFKVIHQLQPVICSFFKLNESVKQLVMLLRQMLLNRLRLLLYKRKCLLHGNHLHILQLGVKDSLLYFKLALSVRV